MIGKRQWYAAPDDTIETWCFLILKTVEEGECEYVIGWELGYGNPTQITDTESEEVESPDREEIVLEQLLEELTPHRYEDVLLIVPYPRTISLLRSRLLSIEAKECVTLRGFSALALSEIISIYFDVSSAPPVSELPSQSLRTVFGESDFEASAEELRQVMNRIGPLVPQKSLTGTWL